MLEIKNLHVKLADEDTEILNGVTLTVPKGQVHAIMGPNGSGKSTLAYVLAGRKDYEVTKGDVLWNGESILEMEPDERAAKGIFLAFQYPLEIPGVATMTFLRTAVNSVRKKRGETEFTTPEFLKRVRGEAAGLGMSEEMLKRPLNVGFSGGEKKRMEILQMAMLQPSLCVMDETDFRARHRRRAHRLRGRQPAALQGPRDARHHALPAAVELHRARQGARDGRRRDRQERRQGTGAGAGEDRLRRVQAQGACARLSAIKKKRQEMTVAVTRTKAEQAYSETFEAVAAKLPGGRAVADARKAAIGAFAGLGFPHRRIEEWKYTDLRAALKEALPPAIADATPVTVSELQSALEGLAALDAHRVVFVNGAHRPDLRPPVRRMASRSGRSPLRSASLPAMHRSARALRAWRR